MNPFVDGKKHSIGLDLFVKGFQPETLSRIYLALTNTRETDRLLLECASLDEMDAEYNPGEPMEEGIFEAVTVRRLSQAGSRMRALSRVFTKYLPETITPAEAIIGKPKKTGLFSSVTAQIPFSDGQVITIVFHSPNGDTKKITPDDEIVAFRWLLNKRDITHVVSPENEVDVSLEEVGKRISQLVAKNSDRFQKTQKDVNEQQDKLATLKDESDKLSKENMDLMNGLKDQQDAAAAAQGKLDRTRGLLEKQQEINADLENQIAALQAKAKADEAERAAREEAARKAAEDAAKAEADRKEAEKAAQAEAEKKAADDAAKSEADALKIIPTIPESELPSGWSVTGGVQFENVKSYVRADGASVAVNRMGNPYMTVAHDFAGKNVIVYSDHDSIAAANSQAIEYMNNYDSLLADYKAATADPTPQDDKTPQPDNTGDTGSTEPAAVATLNDLLSGKYDADTVQFGNILDGAAADLEAVGLIDQYDGLLNQAADYLTALLRKKAA